ncbi:MAG: glycosidase, partial [Anaerolineales bacterium]|nr:glycosidase [Anaerolineales bacterium]
INDTYIMLHRRPPDIWLASSPDLDVWSDHTKIMEPVPDSAWENVKIGAAGPPIKTSAGWVLIYHGVGTGMRYSLGAALLALDDPTEVIARQATPILEPELDWEIEGHVPNVVFSCGHAILDDVLLVYYGAADTVIGVAAIAIDELRFA